MVSAIQKHARVVYLLLSETYMQRVYAGVDVHHEVHLVQVTVTLEACHCTPTGPSSASAIVMPWQMQGIESLRTFIEVLAARIGC